MVSIAGVLVLVSWFKVWALSLTEVFGFVTGGMCVWLVVREHILNWPLGLANNIFFFLLFFSSRLFADMALQVVYFGLGVYGWWNWLHGRGDRPTIPISRATPVEWLALLLLIPLGTVGIRELLLMVNGAAPFWDALTTVLSLVAQYLLCRKRFENWLFWIAADIIYVPLYLSRGLPLTAMLYAVLLLMCLIGITRWCRSLRKRVPANEL
jgi:nicotinamide mononucleotide transporter